MITAERVRVHARGVFFGWWIVLGAVGIQVLHMGLLQQAFGSYATVLQQQFGWSKTTFSLAYAFQRVESGFFGPIQGWLVDRFGPRNVMYFGNVLFGFGFILFSRIDSVTSFYIAAVVMAIGSSFGGFMPIATTVANWFDRRRATALGIMQTGMSIGGLLVPVVAWSMIEFGWRATAFASGIIVIALGLPLSHLMRRRPEDYGYLPDGARPTDEVKPSSVVANETTVRSQVEFTAKEALRTRAFWFISLGHSSALFIVSAVTVHLVLLLVEDHGYSLAGAASVVALMTAMSMVGQLSGGFIGDRFNKRKVLVICMLGHAVALLAVANGSSFLLVAFFAIVHGLCWGTRGPILHSLRADYFGRKSFGTVLGFSSMVIMIGQIIGPIMVGSIADRTGNYQLSFTLVAIYAAVSSIFFVFATRPTPPLLAEQKA